MSSLEFIVGASMIYKTIIHNSDSVNKSVGYIDNDIKVLLKDLEIVIIAGI